MTSCSGQNFIDLLKKIGYPGAVSLNASSFDWMFEEKELIPFLETICYDIEEENILSEAELAEYKEFQTCEILDASQAEKRKTNIENATANKNTEREISEFKEDIAEMENCIEKLELQKDNLNVHILEVFEESKQLKDQKKDFEKRTIAVKENTLPASIEKFITTVNGTVNLVRELDALLNQQPDDAMIKPSKAVFRVPIQPYLDTETNMLESINTYLNDSFQKCIAKVNDSYVEGIPGNLIDETHSAEVQVKQAAEALRLRDVMQSAHVNYFKSVFETKKLEAEIQFFEEKKQNGSIALNTSVVQLQNKLEKVKKAEKEEEHLLEKLPNVIREYLRAQYEWVAILCSTEKLNRYEVYLELLEAPLDIIYEQRARLEFLMMALTIEENNLNDIKQGVASFKQKLENEARRSQERLVQRSIQMEKKPKDLGCVSEGSTLFTLNEIMGEMDNDSVNQLLYLTTKDVIEKAKKLRLKEDDLVTELAATNQEQVALLKSAERNLAMLEKYADNDSPDHPSLLVDKLTMNIGLLASKISTLDEDFLSTRSRYAAKEELILRNRNMALSRELFVYGLTDEKTFKKAINEIKDRLERYEQKKRALRNMH